MILRLFSRSSEAETIAGLYGAIVAQARRPVFYVDYGVPDTVEGRFDMLLLHLLLVIRRMRAEADLALPQSLFDRFCLDMEHNFREMGVGDLAIPKRMRKVGEAFYGRAASYDAALAAPTADALANALARNIYGISTPGAQAIRLADYVRQVEARLAERPAPSTATAPDFPDPPPGRAGLENED